MLCQTKKYYYTIEHNITFSNENNDNTENLAKNFQILFALIRTHKTFYSIHN